MKKIGKAMVSAGGAVSCMGFCLDSGVFRWVPCVLVIAGVVLVAAGIKLGSTVADRTCREALPKGQRYITVEDSAGNEERLIPPLTDFEQVYLSTLKRGKNNGG